MTSAAVSGDDGEAGGDGDSAGADAQKTGEKENVIDEVKDAMEGMLSPDIVEEITGSAEVRETYKISKVGTIAGCMVQEGKIYRSCSRIRSSNRSLVETL